MARKRPRVTGTSDGVPLPTSDGRGAWPRMLRDIYGALVQHAGGDSYISEPLRLVARRAATLEAELRHMEDQFAVAREGSAL